MIIEKFEDIIAWNKVQDFSMEIYAYFDKLTDFVFKNQICRVAVSISNNIADGFNRSSDAEFSKFLYIALASCSEVKSMLYLAARLDYINPDNKNKMLKQCNEISKITRGLIKSLSKTNLRLMTYE